MGADAGPNGGLPPSERTMADRLKAARYRTALFGKWHLRIRRAPSSDVARLRRVLRVSRRRPLILRIGGERCESSLRRQIVEASGYLTDVLTDRVAFIKREKSRPFFLYPRTTPCIPMHAPEKVPVATGLPTSSAAPTRR